MFVTLIHGGIEDDGIEDPDMQFIAKASVQIRSGSARTRPGRDVGPVEKNRPDIRVTAVSTYFPD